MIFLIALCLSMDAFSLSLAYGTNNFKKKDAIILAIFVGFFHFIMPLLGFLIGEVLLSIISIKPSIIASIIFVILGIEMLVESFKKIEYKKLDSIIKILLFSLAVSIDSFSIGISFNAITSHYIISSLIFGLFSFSFTILGLLLGKYINNKIGKLSTILGSIVLIIMGIYYFFK